MCEYPLGPKSMTLCPSQIRRSADGYADLAVEQNCLGRSAETKESWKDQAADLPQFLFDNDKMSCVKWCFRHGNNYPAPGVESLLLNLNFDDYSSECLDLFTSSGVAGFHSGGDARINVDWMTRFKVQNLLLRGASRTQKYSKYREGSSEGNRNSTYACKRQSDIPSLLAVWRKPRVCRTTRSNLIFNSLEEQGRPLNAPVSELNLKYGPFKLTPFLLLLDAVYFFWSCCPSDLFSEGLDSK